MAPPWLILDLTELHKMLLSLMLGGFIVAAIDDVKYLGSTKSFGQWWAVLLIGCFLGTAYLDWQRGDLVSVAGRAILILVFAGLSNTKVGIIFVLALGDIIAVSAVLALLPWVYGLIFLIFLKVLDLVMRPLLRVAGRGDAYPFMPVVVASVLAVLAFAYFIAPALPL